MQRTITIPVLPANWRTTLVGGFCAGAIAALEYYKMGTVDLETLVTVFSIAALGFFAKDAGVSGTEK